MLGRIFQSIIFQSILSVEMDPRRDALHVNHLLPEVTAMTNG